MACGLAQVLQCLLCQHEHLSSNPSPTNIKKKKTICLFAHLKIGFFSI
jgi:hypothetical protein